MDCVRLVAAFIEFSYGEECDPPRVSLDSSVNRPRKVERTMRYVMRWLRQVNDSIEVGDILVTPSDRGDAEVNHAMIVLPTKHSVLHAIPKCGVVVGSCKQFSHRVRIFRPRNKETWNGR